MGVGPQDREHRMRRTRVAILGAGNIGCYLGGWLAAAADVTLIGREARISAIARDGLTVTDLRGRSRTVRPETLTLATDAGAVRGSDYVLLTTKTLGTTAAIAGAAPHLDQDSIIVSFQNGIANADLIDEALAPTFPSRASRPLVLAGMVPFNVVAPEATSWLQTVSGRVRVKDHPRIDPFVRAAQGSGIRVDLEPDMRPVLWGKLLLNLNNAVNGLTGLPLAQQLRDRDARMVLAGCQEETLAVARRLGTQPARTSPLPPALVPALLRSPTPVFAALSRSTLQVSPEARSSMAEDLDAGRPTEIREFQGTVAALGRAHGVPTPVCGRVVDLVREAETRGRERTRWPGGRLRQAVGL